MKIYTKTGDLGQTSLVGGKRIGKDDLRLEAYGTADELNAFVGLLRAQDLEPDTDKLLHNVQNKLFNLGAILASESAERVRQSGVELSAADVQGLEQAIDILSANLSAMRGFVLPAGNTTIALCHVCRTIARRLERRMVALQMREGKIAENDFCLQYVNRLSDLLFILSQKVAQIDETDSFLWEK